MTDDEKIPFVNMAERDKMRYVREKAMMLDSDCSWSVPPTPPGSNVSTPSKKDRLGPKKALTPYMAFSGAMRNKMREEFSNLTMQQLTQKIGERWSSLNDEEKIPYVNMAERDKVRYRREKADFEEQQARVLAGESGAVVGAPRGASKWVSASDRVGPGRFQIPESEWNEINERRKGNKGRRLSLDAITEEKYDEPAYVVGIQKIPREQFRLKCKLCRDPHGACIKCHAKGCESAFHPMCARDAGLHMVANRGGETFALCPKHTREIKAGRQPTIDKNKSTLSCNVCGRCEGQNKDDLMYTCSTCRIAVHRSCYFIKKGTLRMNWQCDPCKTGVDTEAIKCTICQHGRGAMIRTQGNKAWAHVACGMWMPGCGVRHSTAGDIGGYGEVLDEGEAPHGKEELFCICQKPYQEGKLMVGCDDCNQWYHPECVGISDREAEDLEFYQCPSCRGAPPPTTAANAMTTIVSPEMLSLPGIEQLDTSIMHLDEDEDLLQLGSALDGIDNIASPDFDDFLKPLKGAGSGSKKRGWSDMLSPGSSEGGSPPGSPGELKRQRR